MKRYRWVTLLLGMSLLSGCGSAGRSYQQITAEEAKNMMDGTAVVLDVREQNEYDTGHVPGAVLLPVGSITEQTAADVVADKTTVVLVYCRSGSRSKKAAQKLADLGYTNVYEFGGILSWPYDIE